MTRRHRAGRFERQASCRRPSGKAIAATPKVADGTTRFVGVARDEHNYILSRRLPVEGGVNLVLLRAGTATGPVRLTATAAGLNPVALTIPMTRAGTVAGGLSRDFPERFQTGLLTRGPTPRTPSYTVSRTTHVPTSVVTASAPADAGRTIDDNELSRWSSDGRADTAWIEYRFTDAVALDAIDLKLVGWRTRAYPLTITLDGREVWRGETERQLGYAHLTFPVARGSVLRIVQTGPVIDRDAFGKVVELNTARGAGDTGADSVPPGTRLGIVEADFHGPVR